MQYIKIVQYYDIYDQFRNLRPIILCETCKKSQQSLKLLTNPIYVATLFCICKIKIQNTTSRWKWHQRTYLNRLTVSRFEVFRYIRIILFWSFYTKLQAHCILIKVLFYQPKQIAEVQCCNLVETVWSCQRVATWIR